LNSSGTRLSEIMSTSELYFILYVIILAFFAVLVSLSGPGKTKSLMRLSKSIKPADFEEIIPHGTAIKTRNRIPHRGNDEKSDSSLTKPPD